MKRRFLGENISEKPIHCNVYGKGVKVGYEK